MGIEETEECLTDPNKRVIDKITIQDIGATEKVFSEMMGSSAVYRKQFLKTYGKEAIYNAE